MENEKALKSLNRGLGMIGACDGVRELMLFLLSSSLKYYYVILK